jgi:large subunit ribosomal protein L30
MRALGFTRTQQTRVHNDTPAIRGMIYQVRHLVEVTAVEE